MKRVERRDKIVVRSMTRGDEAGLEIVSMASWSSYMIKG